MELKGKVALVTGASTLIGSVLVDRIVAAGAQVVCADIDTAAGEACAQKHGDAARFIATDVTSDDQIIAALDLAEKEFGGLDLLVNVACTYDDGGIETTRDQWRKGLDTNLIGAAIAAQLAAGRMEKRGGGSIVHFGSIAAKVAQPGRMMYSISKAGLLHLAKTQAAALAPRNIRVNSVSPGWTWSNVISMLSNDRRDVADKVGGPLHPLGRIGNPEEVAEAVVFLLSERASFVSGTDIAVDGGYTTLGPEGSDDLIPALQE